MPLNFAPSDNVCALDTSAAPVDVYGSELIAQATTQWAPAFCLDPKLFDLTHVQTPEPQARNLLGTGNIEAAYTSEPPDLPYPNPTVNAPVAVTGFGISFVADNTDQNPVVHLNLDAQAAGQAADRVLSRRAVRAELLSGSGQESAQHHLRS